MSANSQIMLMDLAIQEVCLNLDCMESFDRNSISAAFPTEIAKTNNKILAGYEKP